MDRTAEFEAERPRLTGLAAKVLGDRTEAEDVVQQAWLRLERTEAEIDSLPAWLTTVTTRLCLDRLKARSPLLVDDLAEHESGIAEVTAGSHPEDPADHVALADAVGVALHVVLDRLTPSERVAFVLHDSFGFEFATIASVLDTSPAAARKLASRARAKVAQPAPQDALADWEVVDAFMAAAREGDFERLLAMLAPDAVVRADEAAVLAGTPSRIDGRDAVAQFFNGAAHAALAVYVGDRPASAWYDRGEAKVVFDFTLREGRVEQITFRAAPETLAEVVRRRGADRR
ncbi:sigma-70 family RNA polymerase sigma factor [Nocardioides daphniae]|uniref:Sigma-70 family RNA polymerase sigma factor n=1 Tax=Nocardioides daphniae TaxID=402297 RepID=A0A4P7UL54_9ACTN|nr:sigma-70 family RNA polymerase sigma factor [Nocardioides daphniae]QCC78819.1 sigma-70 family RNA polymerase sigma factor [Nocardioides daphniae]